MLKMKVLKRHLHQNKTAMSETFRHNRPLRKLTSGTDAIKKFTPSLGIPFLGV